MIAQDDAQSVNATGPNAATGPQEPPTREYAFNMPPLGDRFGRPLGESRMAAANPDGIGTAMPPGRWDDFEPLVTAESRRAGIAGPPAEMTEDMARLIRASVPPPANRPINSVEDLLEVVHVLPVVEIFRRMRHLKASRIRRMFDSRKFREHMELRRRLAWEKATTEAAVVVPAAVDRLYRLTLCEKPETARKSCMALVRMGKKDRGLARRSLGEGGTGNRETQARVAWQRASFARGHVDTGEANMAAADDAAAMPPGAAPFRLVPPGAPVESDVMRKSNCTHELGGGHGTPPRVLGGATQNETILNHAAKTGSGTGGPRQSFMKALEARLRKA